MILIRRIWGSILSSERGGNHPLGNQGTKVLSLPLVPKGDSMEPPLPENHFPTGILQMKFTPYMYAP